MPPTPRRGRAAAADAAPATGEAAGYAEQQRKRAESLTPPPPDASIHERFAWVLLHVPDVPKTGHATVQMKNGGTYSYDYVKEPDMLNAIRPLLGRALLAAYPAIDSVARDGNMVTIGAVLELACTVRRGDQVVEETKRVGPFPISATDTGEKAAAKALTTSTRYLFQKAFQIATDGVDPEQENIDHRPGAARGNGGGERGGGVERGRSKTITDAQRRVIYGRASGLNIGRTALCGIVEYGTQGRLKTPEDVETLDDFRWLVGDQRKGERGYLDDYADNRETADKVIADWRRERGLAELEPDPEPGDDAGEAGDDDDPDAEKIAGETFGGGAPGDYGSGEEPS